MRILLIGAYGFIGSAIARHLIAEGHCVTGFGRSASTGQRLLPMIQWIEGDLNRMTRPDDWDVPLRQIDAVINASGALQSGGGDRLDAIQEQSIIALIEACERQDIHRFVQISAPAASTTDPSPFLATKALADARLKISSLHWSILRPGLVVGRNAYGGTALVRALAAMPVGIITVHGDRTVHTVAMDDVVQAALFCLAADAMPGRDVDLVEREERSLADLIASHRQWLGLPPPRFRIDLPPMIAGIAARIADMLGSLGWRSPLRSTAMAMIVRDVTGDAATGEALLGRPVAGLEETLFRHPAGMQDRWNARLIMLMPLIVGALSFLFLLSGAVGLARIDAVAGELAATQLAGATGWWLGLFGSIADLALGLAILIRRHTRAATLGMALLTLAYLAMGSFFRPDLWTDPYAPLAKAVAVLALALVAHAISEER